MEKYDGFWGEEPRSAAGSGYSQWEIEEALTFPRNDGALMVPVFVRLKGGSARRSIIGQVLELASGGGRYLSEHERQYLVTEADRDPEGERDVRTVIFCKPDAVQEPDLWEVDEIGPPILLSETERALNAVAAVLPRSPSAGHAPPLVAIIDDAIGFLNARFRTPAQTTRFRSVWVQSSENVTLPVPLPSTAPIVNSGHEYPASEIDALLAGSVTEYGTYLAENAKIFAPEVHQGTNHAVGHGTHVLDLAAGANPADAAGEPPLLAVQLPAAAVADTSGRRPGPFIVMGVRWAMMQALNAVSATGNLQRGVPLVINLSIGWTGGPKDGTSFMEDWLRNMIATFGVLSQGTPVSIVVAYGNSFRSRLSARAEVSAAKPLVLDWRILPDDRTPSFLEVRVPRGGGIPPLTFSLQPPDGGPALTLGGILLPNQARVWRRAGRRIAAAYGEAETGFHSMLLVVAPTARTRPGETAPPGAWRLRVETVATTPVDVSLEVRRDDTPAGYRQNGRQSWLDHPEGWAWDDERKNWSRPAKACPVTRGGTEVSFAGLRDPAMFFVGAATGDAGRGVLPSPYSAAGWPGGGKGPTLSSLADDGHILTGRLGAGVASGSTARQSGTSVAAPLVTRSLARFRMAKGTSPAAPQPAPLPYDPSQLIADLALVPTAPEDRLGAGVLPDS